MSKESQHSTIGLTQDELKQAVQDSGKSTSNAKLQEKLDNCDLSQPAIELINESDLKAVIEISSGINGKYGIAASNVVLKKAILSIVVVGGIIGGFLLNSTSNEELESSNHSILSDEKPQSETITLPADTVQLEKVSIETNEVHVNDDEGESSADLNNEIVKVVDDSPVVIEDTVEKEVVQVEQEADEKTKVKEGSEQPKIEYVLKPDKAPRRVLGVIVSNTLADKFKGDSYNVSDLVKYEGGNDNLEEDIFSLLKDEIKDTDVPKRSTTVVFNFEVSSRGKIKEVSVQSRVTPELEALIVQKVKTLSNWRKGGKRVAMTYSVFVTFK